MTIQPIGDGSAALYITSADLEQRGLTGSELTLEQATELARDALKGAGLACAGGMEIEAFPDFSGVLVFVRLTRPDRLWVMFDDLDSLLAGLSHLPSGTPSAAALYLLESRCWLSLPPEAQKEEARLTEFGQVCPLTALEEARLLEHGQLIASGEEFLTFRRCFHV